MADECLNWQRQIGDTLTVRVTPKASTNRIKAERMPDGSLRIRVYVTTVAEDGKANAMVLKLLAKALGVAKSALSITHGLMSQDKIIKINEAR